mgnify:CR=1 FL=1
MDRAVRGVREQGVTMETKEAISALIAVIKAVTVTGPDGDGLLWVQFEPEGFASKGAVLVVAESVVGKAVAQWRDARLAAIMATAASIAEQEKTAFTQYRRKQIAELRPYQPGEDLEGVSISAVDRNAGSPKAGDMIARNPKNHADRWLVAAQYFAENFEAVG